MGSFSGCNSRKGCACTPRVPGRLHDIPPITELPAVREPRPAMQPSISPVICRFAAVTEANAKAANAEVDEPKPQFEGNELTECIRKPSGKSNASLKYATNLRTRSRSDPLSNLSLTKRTDSFLAENSTVVVVVRSAKAQWISVACGFPRSPQNPWILIRPWHAGAIAEPFNELHP